jgi:hypothetical protein
MAEQSKDELNKSLKMANMLMGVGMLMTVVPMGLALVSIIISGDEAFWQKLVSLGWSFFVTALLLPVGLALLVFGFGKMVAVNRTLKSLDDADE